MPPKFARLLLVAGALPAIALKIVNLVKARTESGFNQFGILSRYGQGSAIIPGREL